jgi:hypothetical protein
MPLAAPPLNTNPTFCAWDGCEAKSTLVTSRIYKNSFITMNRTIRKKKIKVEDYILVKSFRKYAGARSNRDPYQENSCPSTNIIKVFGSNS